MLPATTGPPGPTVAIFVVIDYPLDQIWLPQMFRFASSGPPVFSVLYGGPKWHIAIASYVEQELEAS